MKKILSLLILSFGLNAQTIPFTLMQKGTANGQIPITTGTNNVMTYTATLPSSAIPTLTAYVPYTGATSSVNLGANSFSVGATQVSGSNLTWSTTSSGYTNNISLRPYGTFTEIPAMYVGVDNFGSTNYAILGDGANNVFNAPTGIFLRTNNTSFLQASTTNTTSGEFIIMGQLTKTLAANSAVSGFRHEGNLLIWNNGTTATIRERYFSPATYSALTTATITDASALDVTKANIGTGMTITRNWGLRVTGESAFSNSVIIGNGVSTYPSANLHVIGTGSMSGALRADGGVGVGVAPSSSRPFNASASVAGEYSYFITNLSAGASAQAAIRLGNNSNEATIGMSSTGATTGNGLYPRSLNFNINEPGGFSFNQQASATSGAYTRFRIWGAGNYTGQTASTEISSFINSTFTRGWATGNITNQREVYLAGITYSAVGASVITKASGLSVDAPIQSTNITITNPFAIESNANMNVVGTITYPNSGGAAVVGNATLVGGTITVNTTRAKSGSYILLTRKTSGGTIGTAITYTISAGTSFTITSDNILDTSTFTWLIVDGL